MTERKGERSTFDVVLNVLRCIHVHVFLVLIHFRANSHKIGIFSCL